MLPDPSVPTARRSWRIACGTGRERPPGGGDCSVAVSLASASSGRCSATETAPIGCVAMLDEDATERLLGDELDAGTAAPPPPVGMMMAPLGMRLWGAKAMTSQRERDRQASGGRQCGLQGASTVLLARQMGNGARGQADCKSLHWKTAEYTWLDHKRPFPRRCSSTVA